jgi:hypothetical protein
MMKIEQQENLLLREYKEQNGRDWRYQEEDIFSG